MTLSKLRDEVINDFIMSVNASFEGKEDEKLKNKKVIYVV